MSSKGTFEEMQGSEVEKKPNKKRKKLRFSVDKTQMMRYYIIDLGRRK